MRVSKRASVRPAASAYSIMRPAGGVLGLCRLFVREDPLRFAGEMLAFVSQRVIANGSAEKMRAKFFHDSVPGDFEVAIYMGGTGHRR